MSDFIFYRVESDVPEFHLKAGSFTMFLKDQNGLPILLVPLPVNGAEILSLVGRGKLVPQRSGDASDLVAPAAPGRVEAPVRRRLVRRHLALVEEAPAPTRPRVRRAVR